MFSCKGLIWRESVRRTGVNSAFDLGLYGDGRRWLTARKHGSHDLAGIFMWGVNWEGGLIFEHHCPQALGKVCASFPYSTVHLISTLCLQDSFVSPPPTLDKFVGGVGREISSCPLVWFHELVFVPNSKGRGVSRWIIFESYLQTDTCTHSENLGFSVLPFCLLLCLPCMVQSCRKEKKRFI